MTMFKAFLLRRCAKEAFVDFATTRNRVLQIAGQRTEYQGWRMHLQLLSPMGMKLKILWIRWVGLYFVVLKSFLNMCPFLTKVVLSACEVSVTQGLYWCSVEMKRFTRVIIYDVSSASMLASVAVQRTNGVAMFEDLRGPKTRGISWWQGDTHGHSNMEVFRYLIWFSQFCWQVAAAS